MSKAQEKNAEEGILQYLTKQNRPYSAIDVYNNLHKVYGKTVVVKVLESLAQEGKIREKLNGKQKAYVVDQSQFPDVPESEMKFMEKKITDLSEKLKTAQANLRQHQTELKGLTSSMSTEEARIQLGVINNQCNACKAKIAAFEAGGKRVTPEEREKVMKMREKYVSAWKKRRRMANDILDTILESYPKPKKALYEDVGIETDEEYNVKIPSK
ncbi:unnamed protein product [Owenia fusiformis]|uniref:Homologous-pairing protein 2 homolog n=1 Tax=Owenia fusiformis TaxID=6347 RepID=A0A8J1UJ10_OWEFU|nr:unnamed protein product [Owenia fusiformis]